MTKQRFKNTNEMQHIIIVVEPGTATSAVGSMQGLHLAGKTSFRWQERFR